MSRAPCALMRGLNAKGKKQFIWHSPVQMLIVCFPSFYDFPGTETQQTPRQLLRSPAELLIGAVSETEHCAIHVLEEVRREVRAEQHRPQAFHGPRLLPSSSRRDNENNERLMHELFLQKCMSVLPGEREREAKEDERRDIHRRCRGGPRTVGGGLREQSAQRLQGLCPFQLHIR